MAWDFQTDPDFQAKLGWMRSFAVEPLGHPRLHPYDGKNEPRRALAQGLYPDSISDIQDAVEAVA